MAGHVTLDGKEYRTKGYPRQVLANQMASKIGQGESKYGDAQSWSAWIQENWRGGAGHVDPDTDVDGFLWSTAETRVPKQVILPPLLQFSGSVAYSGAEDEALCWPFQTDVAGMGTISSTTIDGSAGEKVAMRFVTDSDVPNIFHVGFYAIVPYGDTLKISVYSDNAGEPGSLVASSMEATMLSYNRTQVYEFCCVTLGASPGASDLSATTTYWFVAELDGGSGSATFMTTTGGYDVAAESYDGSTWSTLTGAYIPYASSYFSPSKTKSYGSATIPTGVWFFRLSGKSYMAANDKIHEWDGTKWVLNSSATSSIVALDVFGPKAWMTLISDGYYSFNGSTIAVEDASSFYDIIHNDGKYLWVTDANLAWYSSDGTTFVGDPDTSTGFRFGGNDASIRGVARLEDNVYFSTDKYFYYIAPGDFVVPVIRWGSESNDNGLNMIEYQGALYIPANGRLFRFTPDGTLQDVWLDLEDDLPLERIGRIDDMTVMNSWLVVYVSGQGPNPRGAIMVLQGQSWHCLTTLPNEDTVVQNRTDLSLFYDREHSIIWISMQRMGPLFVEVPDFAINPYNLINYPFMPRGWLEWSMWEGPLVEVTKDFESIAITGEGFDANNYVEVYYQEDGDAAGVWTLHGTVTSNFQELRWNNLATRLTGKRIKIGLLIVSNDSYLTPKIKAVRLQYHLMVDDWFAWNLNIEVAGDLQGQLLPDGTRNSRTAATIKGELDDLCRLDKPFIFIDPLRDQWEVKVKQAEFQYDSYENIEGSSTVKVSGVYHLTLEAVTNGEYTP